MMQTVIMLNASVTSKNEMIASLKPVPSLPPAMGIILPLPVMAASITAEKLAKVPYSTNQ